MKKNKIINFLESKNIVKLEKEDDVLRVYDMYMEDEGPKLLVIDSITEEVVKNEYNKYEKTNKPSSMDSTCWLLRMSNKEFDIIKHEVLCNTEATLKQYIYDAGDSEFDSFISDLYIDKLNDLPEIMYHDEVLRFLFSHEKEKIFIPIFK